MIGGIDPLTRRVHGLARIGIALSLLFGLLPPVGYGLISYGAVRAEMSATGRIRAQAIAQSIALHPQLWMFERERYVDILHQMSDAGESLDLLDRAGTLVASTPERITAPALEVRIPVAASGSLAGELVLRRSPVPLLIGEVGALALGIVLGAALFLAIQAWPLGALRRAIAALKAADESKSLLLSSVGHDLRQPLQSLSLFTSVIADSTLAPSAERAVTMLSLSLSRLGGMLDEIIAIARIDVGAIEENKQPVALAPLFDSLILEMSQAAETKGLRLTRVATRAVTASDPILLSTILRNLLSNAIRYTERGGVVLGCRRRGSSWQIWVADTGIGIPPGQQQRVFEAFYQIGNPERDRTKGLGLGLALVVRLARLLGHQVALRSIPGRGSVFTVTVPVQDQPESTAAGR